MRRKQYPLRRNPEGNKHLCQLAGKCLPERVVGHRSHDDNFLLGDWMDEPGLSGMERDATIGIGTWRAILQVTLDGQTDVGKLATNLMMAACMQRHFEQEVAF